MTIDRKAAIAAYKDRGADAGVFAFRCTTSGKVWVGPTPTLSTIEKKPHPLYPAHRRQSHQGAGGGLGRDGGRGLYL
jgi:hypothetical protein